MGDGTTDATSAVSKCIGQQSTSSGRVVFPPGLWLLTQTVTVNTTTPFDLGGQGWSSNVLWSMDAHLFEFVGDTQHLTMHDLAISSVGATKSPTSTAVRFTTSFQYSVITNVLVWGTGSIPTPVGGPKLAATPAGGGFDFGTYTQTVTLTDCYVWTAKGFAVKIGHGAEVRIGGGRFEGVTPRSGIGVWATGGNGGIHLTSTDIGTWSIGFLANQSTPSAALPFGSNREIFMTHATLDSCGTGL